MKPHPTLLVDLGNTRLKWAFHDEMLGSSQAVMVIERSLADVLTEVWGDLPSPRRAVVVSVNQPSVSDALLAWMTRRWSITPHRVTAQASFLDVRNGYREPQALGADRWAALLGARAETRKSVCVINCGTAVTIDALDAEGEFRGGVILPGVNLMRDALVGGTAAIAARSGDETTCFARSTGDAVAAGSVYGLAGAIERVTFEFEQVLGTPMECLISGGDADRIAAHLRRPARRVPDLVLRGLARIAETLP